MLQVIVCMNPDCFRIEPTIMDVRPGVPVVCETCGEYDYTVPVVACIGCGGPTLSIELIDGICSACLTEADVRNGAPCLVGADMLGERISSLLEVHGVKHLLTSAPAPRHWPDPAEAEGLFGAPDPNYDFEEVDDDELEDVRFNKPDSFTHYDE